MDGDPGQPRFSRSPNGPGECGVVGGSPRSSSGGRAARWRSSRPCASCPVSSRGISCSSSPRLPARRSFAHRRGAMCVTGRRCPPMVHVESAISGVLVVVMWERLIEASRGSRVSRPSSGCCRGWRSRSMRPVSGSQWALSIPRADGGMRTRLGDGGWADEQWRTGARRRHHRVKGPLASYGSRTTDRPVVTGRRGPWWGRSCRVVLRLSD